VHIYRPVNEEYIGMPDTSDEKDAKTFKVMPWRQAIEDLNIAIIA
jgi:hypothetical protein